MFIMRASIAITAVLFFSGIAIAQTPTKYEIEHATGPCKQVFLNKHMVDLDTFELRKGEIYRHSPAVSFSIQLDGTVTDVKLIQSCGIERLDKQVLQSAAKYRFKPRASKCGIIDRQMSLTIDWR